MKRQRNETWRDYIQRLYGARGVEEYDKAVREGAAASIAAETVEQELGEMEGE